MILSNNQNTIFNIILISEGKHILRTIATSYKIFYPKIEYLIEWAKTNDIKMRYLNIYKNLGKNIKKQIKKT